VRAYSTVTDGRHALLYAGDQAPAELYDLETDPRQEHDLVREESGVARELHDRYLQFLVSIDTEETKLALRRPLPGGAASVAG